MGSFIDRLDLVAFVDDLDPGKAAAMIEDAEAMAILTAPCLSGLSVIPAGETADAAVLRLSKIAGVKAILRAAILRWNEAGSGAVSAKTVGPFGQTIDTRVQRRSLFWPSEI